MTTITAPKELLEECFRNILNEYGVEDVGTLADIILKAEKYRWHDLRKEPEDLPKDGERVIFYTVEFEEENEQRYYTGECNNYGHGEIFYSDDYEGYATKGGYYLDEVIAWKYIEPFEEVE